MLYTIYRIVHKDSGKYYIGKHQTNDLNDGYMGSGRLIRRAVKKYGVEAFEKEVLHVFETEVEMNTKEAELVNEEFCLREDTYNLCPGGQGGWGYVNTNGMKGVALQTEELKKRISGSLSKRWKNLDELAKRNENDQRFKLQTKSWAGLKHSEESKKKISNAAKLRTTNSQTGTCWINNGSLCKKIQLSDLGKYPGWIRGRKVSSLSFK